MVNLTINGQPVSVKEGTSIMDAAQQVGFEIPHLCYLREINEIGACRVCLVEIEGMDKLVTACNTACAEGMVVHTNSLKVRRARKINVELILSDHNSNCAYCTRSGHCSLQKVANDMGIYQLNYAKTEKKMKWNMDLPIIRDASKCINCMRCIQICDKVQSLGIWDVIGSGRNLTVGTRDGKLETSSCALCGQCITHCPVGALRERDDRTILNDAIGDPDKITIVQVAPAVRAAWGMDLGLAPEDATMGKLVNVLKKIGADYVFDTNFTADLTIMEEGNEFLERLASKDEHKWPMFTSCCPGWVRFVKSQYPDMVANLSTAKSPQQMFGAMTKTYIAEKLGVDPEKIYSISIMPCTAKKYECTVEEVNDSGHGSDVDLVLTTRELIKMVRCANIQVERLEDMPYDDFFGTHTGAGVIFGATGGVMEAALRSAYAIVTGENPEPDAFKAVRGMDGWKEEEFDLAGTSLKVAIASGLGNARKLIEAIRAGEVSYDFVEIMACPGGCVGGGGQPFEDGCEFAPERADHLYKLDAANELRFSHENPVVQMAYEEFLETPLSHKSHELLHTDLEKWNLHMEQK